MHLTVADLRLTMDEARELLIAFAQDEPATLAFYDLGGKGVCAPSDGVDLVDIGRMTLMNPQLYGDDVALLLLKGRTAPWSEIKHGERLEDAIPNSENPNSLFQRALRLYQHFTSLHNIKDGKASKLLHMKRPHFYPVLDSLVMSVYRKAKQHHGSFWEAIRQDLLKNERAFNQLKEVPSALGEFKDLGKLPNVRLQDIVAWSIGKRRDPYSGAAVQ